MMTVLLVAGLGLLLAIATALMAVRRYAWGALDRMAARTLEGVPEELQPKIVDALVHLADVAFGLRLGVDDAMARWLPGRDTECPTSPQPASEERER